MGASVLGLGGGIRTGVGDWDIGHAAAQGPWGGKEQKRNWARDESGAAASREGTGVLEALVLATAASG